jgi:DNA-binding NarL/FixJ family response regulator
LRLAQGQVDVARTGIFRALEESRPGRTRTQMLAAAVEIALAAGDIAAARTAAIELSQIAVRLDAPFLHGLSAQATGAVLLAEDDPRGALAALRTAAGVWRDLEAPHDLARTRVLIGLACRALGDTDSAELELDAARHLFDRLGANSDRACLDALALDATPARAGVLTGREVQVLRLVATGRTNRAIATELGLSEKTVARHLSNIFTKLGLSSRAAATAYAYQQGLVEPGT